MRPTRSYALSQSADSFYFFWEMFVRSLLAGLLLASCADCASSARNEGALKVRWPASAPVVLEEELRATAIEQGEAPAPPDEQPRREVPGVRVRDGVAVGLYYIEVILGDADFDDPLPLVVLLHGRGDRPRVPGGPFAGAPTPMRLIMPRGPRPLGEGFSWLPVSITQGKTDVLAASLRARAHHVAALIETIRTSRPTVGRPIVAGFSQGGMLAFAVGLHRPDVVGHAFPLAGWVPPPLMPEASPPEHRRTPMRSLHGDADPIIPIGPTREVVARLSELGWSIDLLEFAGVGHVMTREMNATFEGWLEAALAKEAPGLEGGLGQEGPEDEPYAPWEPLEPETIEAIMEQDADKGAAQEEEPGEESGEEPGEEPGEGE
jgi:phospholipase/carboxylesterase